VNIDSAGVVVLMSRFVAMSYARAREHARGRSTSLWTDCTVKRGGDSRKQCRTIHFKRYHPWGG
jgi:hypothetical protein